MQQACPTKDKEKCDNCGKQGHNRRVCISLLWKKHEKETEKKEKGTKANNITSEETNEAMNKVEQQLNTLRVSDADPSTFGAMFEPRL